VTDATIARGLHMIGALRARPLHVGLAAFVAGLALGPRWPLIGLLVLAPVLARRMIVVLALAAALLGGGAVADARLAALDRSSLGPMIGHAVSVRVTLLEAPRVRAFGGREATVGLGAERVLVRASLGVPWPSGAVGSELGVSGGLQSLGSADGWLRSRNVHAVLGADAITVTGRARGGAAGALDRVRVRVQRALDAGLPPAQAALARGMVLGQDEALSEATRDRFRRAGLAHLLAASGQNVALLAALALAVAALLGVGLRVRLVSVIALIAAYVPLAGAGPSIQRAGVMGAAGVVAALASRPASRSYALLLAAAVTLALNPRASAEPGWQLSFAAVIAIALVGRRLAGALARRGLPRGLAEVVALTVAATLATAPLVALHFERTSLVALGANVLAAPAVAPVMWLGTIAGAVGQIDTSIAAPLSALAGYPLAYVGWVGEAAAGVPLAEVRAPPLLVALACAALVALAVATTSARAAARWRPARAAALAGAALVIAVGGATLLTRGSGLRAPDAARITVLDVGQGDAILLQHRASAILIDAGPPDGPVVARLRRAGVARLDALVVTHAQADHDGGAAAVLRELEVGLVLDGRDGVRDRWGLAMAAEARRRRVRMVVPDVGQVLRAGGIELRILWPAREAAQAHAGQDPNQRPIVALARVGRVRALLASDAESEVLSGLALEPVDVLKVAHHGSADPGLAAALAVLRPRVAAIAVGAANRYGHPAPSTLRTLRAAGAHILRTDRDATVRVDDEGSTLRVTRAG